jgi:hypothetical protein
LGIRRSYNIPQSIALLGVLVVLRRISAAVLRIGVGLRSILPWDTLAVLHLPLRLGLFAHGSCICFAECGFLVLLDQIAWSAAACAEAVLTTIALEIYAYLASRRSKDKATMAYDTWHAYLHGVS